jgi:hypothetical protein
MNERREESPHAVVFGPGFGLHDTEIPMPNVDSVLRDHVVLHLDCIDRVYLNGYVPGLQRPEQLWWFLHDHRGPIVSPALLQQMTTAFVAEIEDFAHYADVPIVHFQRGQRKEEVARQRLARFRRKEGVVFIGIAQENVSTLRPIQKGPRRHRRTKPGARAPSFNFYRGTAFVNQYYFYLLDRDFGLCFIKFSSFAPFGVRIWINGHEWAKRQLAARKIGFAALDNGFLSCADPDALQQICDSFNAEHVDAFFRKWLRRLPHPFTRKDRAAGYRYQLSILQLEVSLTQVFDRPVHGREFFEEVIRDNLDLGRPDRVQLLFERRVTRRTPGRFRTRVITDGVQPSLRIDYKRTGVKQYFKLGRALRTETTFHDTYDFEIRRALGNLSRLRTLGRHINHRVLTLERIAQHCAISAPTVERIILPSVDGDQRAPALRWGDPRIMALFSALCALGFTPTGFTNATLRERVAALFDPGPTGYTPARMTYDLRRLRLKGLVHRVPHTHRYLLTPLGRRVAFFMSKSFTRIVRPVLQRLDPALPDDPVDGLRAAWRRCERALDIAIEAGKIAA